MLWVVPTRFDPTRPVIYECIEAIQHFHDNPAIVVVDSDSEDRSYLDWCRDRGCIIADIHNRGYAHGAFAWAIREYPNNDFYALIFDSVIPQANLDHLQERPVTAIRHWSNLQHDWGWDSVGRHLSFWGDQQLHRMGIPFPLYYTGIMGPVMFAQRSVIDALDSVGYWNTAIHDAYEHCGLERVAGIVLESLGYSVAESLQGIHFSHNSPYDESLIAKRNMARA